MPTDPTCEARVDDYLTSALSDLQAHKQAMEDGLEETPELGSVYEYGLGFDYVPAGTFTDQREGYFRWQLSWGGPSDEFRFYVDAEKHCHRIEYLFLDWYDGASRTLRGSQEELLLFFFNWFDGMGAIDNALKEATK